MTVSQSPDRLLEDINGELCKEDSTMVATIFCGILNTNTGKIVFYDGGHCTPYIVVHDGEV
jgi:sigma-B regulation protein RsbU (phosphoserine phosphatase)